MAKEICCDCEAIFEAKTNKAFLCPKCRKRRLSQYAKLRNLNKIGNDAYSAICARRRESDG